MWTALLRALATALTALAVLAPAAAAKKGRTIYGSPLLWATVNLCDTAGHPDTIGVRASIPGSGVAGERMFLRFQVQYYAAGEGEWHNLQAGGDSSWIAVGSGGYAARQAGRTFRFQAPTGDRTEVLRGAVTFEWRSGARVVRRARKRTAAGHRGEAGGDPPGYSAAVCELESASPSP
jgi:hypothetical protein